MADFLYYWQKQRDDLSSGPIFKLNQNSRMMERIAVGDDVWAIGLVAAGAYSLIARFTVSEVGDNPPGSSDLAKYGMHFFRSTKYLTNYFTIGTGDVEPVIRSLSIRCEGLVLGQTFQGAAAVRALTAGDRKALVAHAAAL